MQQGAWVPQGTDLKEWTIEDYRFNVYDMASRAAEIVNGLRHAWIDDGGTTLANEGYQFKLIEILGILTAITRDFHPNG